MTSKVHGNWVGALLWEHLRSPRNLDPMKVGSTHSDHPLIRKLDIWQPIEKYLSDANLKYNFLVGLGLIRSLHKICFFFG